MSKTRDLGYDFIRCTAMLMILLHHFYTTCKDLNIRFPSSLKEMFLFFGGGGVALFFLLSGAVLINRYRTDLNIKTFFTKRFLKICIPQWIGFLAAFWLVFILNKNIIHSEVLGTLISFLGLNYSSAFWNGLGIHVLWIIGEWFTAVIIILYLLFPSMRWLFIKHRLIGSIGILSLCVLNLKFQVLSYYNGFFSITNGIMYFWLGMLFDEYKKLLNKRMLLGLFITFVLFTIYNPKDLFEIKYIPCLISSLLAFPLLYQIRYSNRFTQYICKYNYELYLTHHRIYIILMPALLKVKSNDLQIILAFIFLTLIVCYFSELLAKASQFTIQKLNFYKE